MLEKTQATLDDDQIEKLYCIYFDSSRYWGKLKKVFADDPDEPAKSVEIDFLHYKFNGFWDYPKGGDVKIDAKFFSVLQQRFRLVKTGIDLLKMNHH